MDYQGRLFRLENPSGWGAKSAGLLYPRKIKPPQCGMGAIIEDGEIYWQDAAIAKAKGEGD